MTDKEKNPPPPASQPEFHHFLASRAQFLTFTICPARLQTCRWSETSSRGGWQTRGAWFVCTSTAAPTNALDLQTLLCRRDLMAAAATWPGQVRLRTREGSAAECVFEVSELSVTPPKKTSLIKPLNAVWGEADWDVVQKTLISTCAGGYTFHWSLADWKYSGWEAGNWSSLKTCS